MNTNLTLTDLTLDELTRRTGLDVLDHLDRQVRIPVVDGLQAQGDLIVVPFAILGEVDLAWSARWRPVPAAGVELLRGAGGGNAHTLVAGDGVAEWTTDVRDDQFLAIGALRNTRPAYLIHPEHGGTGIAPGSWLIRRQREGGGWGGGGSRLVAD